MRVFQWTLHRALSDAEVSRFWHPICFLAISSPRCCFRNGDIGFLRSYSFALKSLAVITRHKNIFIFKCSYSHPSNAPGALYETPLHIQQILRRPSCLLRRPRIYAKRQRNKATHSSRIGIILLACHPAYFFQNQQWARQCTGFRKRIFPSRQFSHTIVRAFCKTFAKFCSNL